MDKDWNIPLEIDCSQTLSVGEYTGTTKTQFLSSIWLSERKNSDLTGSFVPGIYQVKPYSVFREEINTESEQVCHVLKDGIMTWTWIDKGNVWTLPLKLARQYAPSPDFGNLPTIALAKAKSKLTGVQAGMGENLGEMKETFGLMVHPLKSLRDFLSNTNWKRLGLLQKLQHYNNTGRYEFALGNKRVGVWAGGAKQTQLDAADAAMDTWMELRYGLRPLIYAVQDLMDLATAQAQAFRGETIRSCKADKRQTRKKKYTIPSSCYRKIVYSSDCTCKDDMHCHASVQYRLSAKQELLDKLGLAARHLPATAWELTMMSYVVDWIFNVGDWIECLRFNPLVTVLGNTVGNRLKRTVSAEIESTASTSLLNKSTHKHGTRTYTEDSFTRLIQIDSAPLPQFLQSSNLSYLKAVDALALIWQHVLSKQARRK